MSNCTSQDLYEYLNSFYMTYKTFTGTLKNQQIHNIQLIKFGSVNNKLVKTILPLSLSPKKSPYSSGFLSCSFLTMLSWISQSRVLESTSIF